MLRLHYATLSDSVCAGHQLVARLSRDSQPRDMPASNIDILQGVVSSTANARDDRVSPLQVPISLSSTSPLAESISLARNTTKVLAELFDAYFLRPSVFILNPQSPGQDFVGISALDTEDAKFLFLESGSIRFACQPMQLSGA